MTLFQLKRFPHVFTTSIEVPTKGVGYEAVLQKGEAENNKATPPRPGGRNTGRNICYDAGFSR
jgi:hypothetical protein